MKPQKIIFFMSVVLFLLICSILLFQNNSFEIQEESLSFYQSDENGNSVLLQVIPFGKNYDVTVTCDARASGRWDYKNWGPIIKNMTSKTKCNVLFAPQKPLFMDVIKSEASVINGNGIYEVSHEFASIDALINDTEKSNLKQKEYRYAGIKPNNYVRFNDEIWRVIGLVNTSEGQRVKLLRNQAIGNLVWDTSDSLINSGLGVNEWSQSDIMRLLNPGYESFPIGGSFYWKKEKGICYKQRYNASAPCDYTGNGMMESSKEMIDSVTWNLGTTGNNNYKSVNIEQFYSYERGNFGEKFCTSGSSCNDTITRTTIWRGKVGLLYPSDYGYATSGGDTINRDHCLNSSFVNWKSDYDCYINNWIYELEKNFFWLMTPNSYSEMNAATKVMRILSGSLDGGADIYGGHHILPTIYLNTNVIVIDGIGTVESPYILGVYNS